MAQVNSSDKCNQIDTVTTLSLQFQILDKVVRERTHDSAMVGHVDSYIKRYE